MLGLAPMKAVPWRRIQSWTCVGCGECCRLQVQLTTSEWLDLTHIYGYRIATQSIDGFFINKTLDGWCPFLYRTIGGCLCSLQENKPLACRLWPFRVSDHPRYGFKEEAYFNHRGSVFYIYAIPYCNGIKYGTPTEHLVKNILPEFIDLRIGFRKTQIYSTGKAPTV
jgi:hypothetical protein